ncbi:DUF551 domain-containing protein [Moraxella bovis]|uniref:Protein of uncharacterized function (DUF551) n=1 Tax=Moraxella bovis TaxID=476 RepID=A0A378PYM9_MORBO|nr:DUF551 domain-containing protein [Moraxella bovis]UYZ69994.1 DUF551 domain-containing protein [Moraxella bovis]UZA28362.1 DUF551 domain-containing protein [Moraxella bovis]STY93185.1 Protein of uncharacterised function (DUF551) [Moraxella bovis]STY93386.1 Protein of uncharacterised function (DUF551) [Moraxella bovis]
MNKPKYFSITYDMSKLSDDEQKAVIAEASSLFRSQKAVCAGWENDGVTNNGWISVDDRLPPLETVVLVYQRPLRYVLTAEYLGDRYEFSELMPHDTRVTHWQPLPKPPKE